MRRAAKVDNSQKAIVAALRAAGAFVYVIGQPVDLLVFYRSWILLECKTGTRRRKDQPAQDAFCKTFGVPIVRTEDEALAAIGAVRDRG
jgi:hypothetical protein